MEHKKFGAFTSVENPEKFSQMWSGVIGTVGTIAVAFLTMKGVDAAVANEQITQITNALTLVVMSGLTVWNAVQAIIGAVKKLAAK